MHIPDGIIPVGSNYQIIIYTVIAIIILAIIFYKTRKELTEKDIPLIAMFIVAAVVVQLIELPLPVAACVHASLITIIALYDLKKSVIVYTFVTIIQALLIHEGGVSVIGINLLNLAIIAPIAAYSIYHLLSSINKQAALFISGFGTISLLGLIASIEYAIAGAFPISFGLTVITPIEVLVGVLEGFVTLFVMNTLVKLKPELVPVLTEEK